jgi:hypothetical protein
MNNAVISVSGLLAVAVTVSMPASADNHEQANVDPVDMYMCTFREGKGLDDLDKLDARWKKWAAKNDPGQSAWRLVPVLRATDDPYAVGYLGSWTSGEAMGAGMDAWAGGGDLLEEYVATIDCKRAVVASVEVNAPNGPPENGVVWFSSCTVNEGSTLEDAYKAHSAVSAAMREMGGKAQSWLFYPSLGFGDVPFDYYSVVTFNSMSELGAGWEMYYNKGGWKKAADMNDAADCDSPRVYSANAMQMGPQD